jgi:hypothetical protein
MAAYLGVERLKHKRFRACSPKGSARPCACALQGAAGGPSVQLELKLFAVLSAPSNAAPDRDYLPVLARKNALEVAIELLAVGRRNF